MKTTLIKELPEMYKMSHNVFIFKKILLILIILIFFNNLIFTQEMVRIYGRVTDFFNNPVDSALVLIKNKNFENLYEGISDKNGYFSIYVPKNIYYCIYVIKPEEYGKSKLEYWAWNVPAYEDLNINPKYDRMEIYGINAFEPQVRPF